MTYEGFKVICSNALEERWCYFPRYSTRVNLCRLVEFHTPVAFNLHSKRNSFVRILGMKPLVALDGYAMLVSFVCRGTQLTLCASYYVNYVVKNKFKSPSI